METDSSSKVAVVTGASSGIGRVAAIELARLGFTVIALGRNPVRSKEALADIRREAPGATVELVIADLSSLAQTRRAAGDIAKIVRKIDVLVNNAGGLLQERHVTEDGFEATFAGNHLGPFLLTTLLLPQLRSAQTARIINVSSVGHTMISDMVWDDLQLENDFTALRAYYQSKLANILFTRALSESFAEDGITANAMHPGMIASRFPATAGEAVQRAYKEAAEAGYTVGEEAGADTIVWLAVAPEAAKETGGYFINRVRSDMSPAAENMQSARRLWDISSKLAKSST